MRRTGLFVSAVLALVALSLFLVCHLQAAEDRSSLSMGPNENFFDRSIQDAEQQVERWELQAGIQLACIIAVGAFGVAVTALETVRKKWGRVTIAILGIATSVGTGINSQGFTADHRSLGRAAAEGRATIRRMYFTLGMLREHEPTPDDFNSFKEEFVRAMDELDQTRKKLEHRAEAGQLPGFGNSFVVHADAGGQDPEWLNGLRRDEESFYFRGQGTAESLSEAESKSRQDAVNKASLELIPGEPYSHDKSVIPSIEKIGSAEETFFRYDKTSGLYTYYTLFRVSKRFWSIRPVPAKYQQEGWRPIHLAFDPSAGMFVLDSDGVVSKVTIDQSGIHLKPVLRLPLANTPISLAVNTEALFVSSNNRLGCHVHRYSFSTRATAQRLAVPNEPCGSIASDGGNTIYLLLPVRKQVWRLQQWNSSFQSCWSFRDSERMGVLAFDRVASQLIFASESGSAYTISFAERKMHELTNRAGVVRSIATDRNHILMASGGKVLFYGRSSKAGVNPPDSMHVLGGGRISGVAIDTAHGAWISNMDHGFIQGPLPLN